MASERRRAGGRGGRRRRRQTEKPDPGPCCATLAQRRYLEGIYRHYGFDFRSYAYSSIRRRIWKRIEAEGLPSVSALQDRVLHDRPTMERLLHDLLGPEPPQLLHAPVPELDEHFPVHRRDAHGEAGEHRLERPVGQVVTRSPTQVISYSFQSPSLAAWKTSARCSGVNCPQYSMKPRPFSS